MSVLDALHQLYLADQKVRGLESRMHGASGNVRANQLKLEQAQQAHRELADQLAHTKATEATLESEASGIDERIAKLREQMNTAKTNKEYSAFLVEVNTLKADKSKLEDQAIDSLTKVDDLTKRTAEAEALVAERVKIKELADKELADRQAEVRDSLEEARAERQVVAKEVPDTPLALFEKLADMFDDGEAMAAVEQDDPRLSDYTCGGCYMTITMENVNKLMTGEGVVQCNSCSRILYLSQQVKETMGVRS